jgi:hypothetical protein
MSVLLSILFLVAAGAAAFFWVRLQATAKARDAAAAELQTLAPYRGILDAEARARVIHEQAEAEARARVEQAQREADARGGASMQAEAAAAGRLEQLALEQARRAEEANSRLNAAMESARADAARIVADANARAHEIAGDAMAAAANARQLEQTVRALKNTIEGYGDAYLVPGRSLIDDLADEFGFTEAGEQLKAARTEMRRMMSAGVAASCDYVEEGRRSTAINFVLDAFNGKVDTILSSVKEDNVGTLRQKIRDAFALVNRNGAAFRNARINDAYLAIRLEELRWGAVAHELKLKDREEQRQIRERIREEERAQRDYERAIREAEKEEQMLRKAMEKLQKEFAKATDEQKASYEAQIIQLGERLQTAEERSQRAMSMAQQTRAGTVYIISNVGSFGEDVYKIGLTRRLEPLDRVRELGDASVPFEFDVHALIASEDAPKLENELHKRFVRAQVNKVNARKEFFRLPLTEIRSEVESMGHETGWTLAASCREYRESLAIEATLQADKAKEAEWEAAQIRQHDAAVGQDEEAAAQ